MQYNASLDALEPSIDLLNDASRANQPLPQQQVAKGVHQTGPAPLPLLPQKPQFKVLKSCPPDIICALASSTCMNYRIQLTSETVSHLYLMQRALHACELLSCAEGCNNLKILSASA